MFTFDKMVLGLGTAGTSVRKDIYKAARLLLTDRVMSARCAAATVSTETVGHIIDSDCECMMDP